MLDEEEEYRTRRINDLQTKESTEGLIEEEHTELQMLLDWLNEKRRKELEELLEK